MLPATFGVRMMPVREVQVAASELREGNLIEMEGGVLWRVMSRNFSRTAMGRAFIQAELKSLVDGVKKDVRFRSDEMVEQAALENAGRFDVLYGDGEKLTLMHRLTYEQTELPIDFLGEKAKFVHDGMILNLETFKGQPAVVTLPSKVTVKVTALDPSGGDTCTVVPIANDAPADVETAAGAGFKARLPKHIGVGDRVLIDTEAGKYVSKA